MCNVYVWLRNCNRIFKNDFGIPVDIADRYLANWQIRSQCVQYCSTNSKPFLFIYKYWFTFPCRFTSVDKKGCSGCVVYIRTWEYTTCQMSLVWGHTSVCRHWRTSRHRGCMRTSEIVGLIVGLIAEFPRRKDLGAFTAGCWVDTRELMENEFLWTKMWEKWKGFGWYGFNTNKQNWHRR